MVVMVMGTNMKIKFTSRSMWQTKRAEELELAARDMEEVLPIVIIVNIIIIIILIIITIIVIIIIKNVRIPHGGGLACCHHHQHHHKHHNYCDPGDAEC